MILVHFHNKPSIKCLADLSSKVIEYLRLNKAILYLYFDHADNINIRERGITPQEYRGNLFGFLIERYAPKTVISKRVQIEGDEIIHLITLICHKEEVSKLEQLQDEVRKQGDK